MLKVNSKKINPGDTFIAIKSKVRDGHDYITDAIDRGAACIIAEKGEYSVKTIIVPDTKAYLSKYLKELYEDKLSKIKLIGVTGTNGKTISSYLIYELLNKMGIKTAYIGAVGFYLPDKNRPLVNTNPDLYDLYEMIVEAVNEECEIVTIEVNSRALDERRLEGIKFDIACFTNLTEYHPDYYSSMEEYKNSKLKLFNNIKEYTIINMDDPYGKDFVLNKNKNILIGQNNYDYQICDIKVSNISSTFKIKHNEEERELTLPIPGVFNIYNYLNAYIICDKLRLNMDQVVIETANLTSPKGHYQVIKNNKFTVIVDYAHTPTTVLNIIKSVKDYTKGRIITVIGCGGEQNKDTRPIIGKIVTEYSDYVFFTNDNPRNEDPEEILKDITTPLEKRNFEIIPDRIDAIKKAINTMTEEDVLLVLGKGHEQYQIIGKEKIYLSDIEEITKNIK